MIHNRSNFAVIVLISLAGCASTPVEDHYYSLVLAADDAETASTTAKVKTHLIVGPIQLPAYLDSRGLTLQTGSSQIETANHHFWAEPLDEAISKVLARDIPNLIDGVAADRDAGRWTDAGDCRLRVEFDKFHATYQSRVVSSGRYWVSSPGASVKQEFNVVLTLSADGYAHAVEKLRQSLGVLATQIAATIETSSNCYAPSESMSKHP